MDIDAIETKINEKLAMAAGFDAVVKFNFKDDGAIMADTTENPPALKRVDADHDDDVDLELITSLETFGKILNGTQDPNIAFMMGKLKVKGNMGLAMKLNGILED